MTKTNIKKTIKTAISNSEMTNVFYYIPINVITFVTLDFTQSDPMFQIVTM